jgi:hypothetical protein
MQRLALLSFKTAEMAKGNCELGWVGENGTMDLAQRRKPMQY